MMHRTSAVSHRLSTLALAVAFAALLGLYTGCKSYPKGPITVPLEYRTEHSDPLTGSLPATDVRVHLEAVEDKRQNKEQIGQNVQDATPLPAYGSGKSPAEFVRDVFDKEMRGFGLELVDAPETADRIISIKLDKFWVTEGGDFRGEVGGAVEVKDKGGKVRWRGRMAGDAKTFGRSRNPENYQEVLSDATRRAVGSLINIPQFGESLSR